MEQAPKQKNRVQHWFEKITDWFSSEPQTRDELVDVLHDAEENDLLSQDMLQMIERILHVADMQTREVMVTRPQMVVLSKDSSLDQLIRTVIDSGHSRFPVVDPNTFEVQGILLAKDFLPFYFNRDIDSFNIKKIIRPAVLVPQSKRLDILLREFRINRNHLAIVLDEYGQTAGLITIEDVLEQIVGSIEDEYDIDEDKGNIKMHADGCAIVKALTPIPEFNRLFNTNFDDDEFDTIGGIVLHTFGHLPKRGEKLKLNSLYFKVLNSDHRRIHLLEVRKKIGKASATKKI